MHQSQICPLCRSQEIPTDQEVLDHSISKESFNIAKCSSCGFSFTNPVPGPDAIGRYYRSEDYISHSNTSKTLRDSLYQIVRKRAVKQKSALIRKWSRSGQLLDYGCGTGEFASYMASRGFKVHGVEPDLHAREQAIRNHGIDAVPSLDSIVPSEQFDVISLWHVLEHIHELRDTMKWFYAALKNEGTMFVAVPNIESWDAKHYASDWAALDVPRHLYHFRQADIERLFGDHGFSLQATQNMWMDSFYISMLSEQYRGAGNLSSLFKGVTMGLISNLKTLSSHSPTSSTLYIFKKSPI